MISASICTIGDEILIGQIVDTNSSYIARELNKIGIKVNEMLSIGDSHDQISGTLRTLADQNDIVITTGGLGPTKDDITKEALAELTGAKGFVQSYEQMAIIEAILKRRNIPMLESNKNQASVPDSCRVIVNKLGTAPCMAFEMHRMDGSLSMLYSLPGVPFEAIGALPDVINDIKQHFSTEEIIHKTIVTFGIAESILAEKIKDWESALPQWLHLAYLPNPVLGVRLRLSCYGAEEAKLARMEQELATLRNILGNAVYGEEEESLQSILSKLLMGPPERLEQETLSVAESCTGGYLSHLITSVSGCSAYYKGSVTSYSNEVKINVLGVPASIIESHGAVSRECAEAMAKGVATLMDTDYAIATTGIAGPGGGSATKPVGLCWIAAVHRNRTAGTVDVVSKQLNFASSREVNIQRFASNALNLLRMLTKQNLF